MNYPNKVKIRVKIKIMLINNHRLYLIMKISDGISCWLIVLIENKLVNKMIKINKIPIDKKYNYLINKFMDS